MPSRPFVHLHCHSHYSLLDGASKIPALAQRAKGLGMDALALTDHGNLYGAVEFLREAKGVGLKPIIGLEAYVAPARRSERAGVSGRAGRFFKSQGTRHNAQDKPARHKSQDCRIENCLEPSTLSLES